MNEHLLIPLRTDYTSGARVVGPVQKFTSIQDTEHSINNTVVARSDPQIVGWVVVDAYGYVSYFNKNGQLCSSRTEMTRPSP